MKKAMARLGLLVLVLILKGCVGNEPTFPGSRPNIVLIVLDDVAHEQFSMYGGKVPTPHIDALASRGMAFERAFTPSAACTPSRFALLTGRFPGSCVHPEFLDTQKKDEPYSIAWNSPVSETDQTLHKALGREGYFTGYVGKFHIGELSYEYHEHNPLIPAISLDAELESELTDSLLTVHQTVVAQRVKELTGANYAASIQWANPETYPVNRLRTHHVEWITEGALDFLKDCSDGTPFFLHINTTTLHGPHHGEGLERDPYYTPEGRQEEMKSYREYRSEIVPRLAEHGLDMDETVEDHRRHYRAGILLMDDQVGQILQKLHDLNFSENTLVILAADHNLEPGKSTTYDRGTRVPFILRWPGMLPAGKRSMDLVSFTDLLPTFLELAGSDRSYSDLHGTSILPALKVPGSMEERSIYLEEGYTRAVRKDGFKYIATRFPSSVWDRILSGEFEAITHMGVPYQAHSYIAMEYHPGYFDPDQLYDLENDPFEQHNLASDPAFQGVLLEMKEELKRYLDLFDHPFDLSDTTLFSSRAYKQAAGESLSRGTGFIPWWNRQLDYPPATQIPAP
jgi:arylsulfatase A-like enzyme